MKANQIESGNQNPEKKHQFNSQWKGHGFATFTKKNGSYQLHRSSDKI
jgi:hypothetical protein